MAYWHFNRFALQFAGLLATPPRLDELMVAALTLSSKIHKRNFRVHGFVRILVFDFKLPWL